MARNLGDVGGTRGGIGLFVFGLAMAIAGGYLLMNQVTVHGGYWNFGGFGYGQSFGLTLLPLLAGIGFLFYDAKSIAGWVLSGGGGLIVVVGIIVNMQIHFQPTTLYNTLLILGLLAGGLGLVFRSLRPVGGAPAADAARD